MTTYKVSDIQEAIFKETGLKTSVKKMSGSMKEHLKIWPIFQSGEYPQFPFEWVQTFKKQFYACGQAFPYVSTFEINVPLGNFSDLTPIVYKKESKPKPIDPDKPAKEWGSKNSQMRLDKASARYAKKLNKGNCARYY